jgi:transposase-like protein
MLRYQPWFKLWITKSCSIKFLSELSGYSEYKLKGIKNYWLRISPREHIDYSLVRYMVYDATYFHKDGCLMNLMDGMSQKIIAHTYVKKESFQEAYPWFYSLKCKGLNPVFITTDGEQRILRAMKLVWPNAKLQRCLYHIQHEGMRWLRSHPKSEAGRELRDILSVLSNIKSPEDRESFIHRYCDWRERYEEFMASLPRGEIAARDLKRTVALISHALPDMFYFLDDKHIYSTTNALEGFHSRLKADYQRHRGLTSERKLQYVNWYCYYENIKNNNTN